LVAAIASGYHGAYKPLGPLRDIFGLSLEMIDYDRNSGFGLLFKRLDSYWCWAMTDLIEDPQGEFFIDDNQYADIALHMVKYMSAGMEYVPSAGYPVLVMNVACRSYPLEKVCLILDMMAKSFPKILAKSSIRPDLVECFRNPMLAAANLENLLPAITTYISVSDFIAAHPLCLTHSQRFNGGGENIPKFLGHVESQVILIS
jgi:hypothetical protein